MRWLKDEESCSLCLLVNSTDSYQIRVLTLGELLDEAYILFRRNWMRLVGFQLIVFVPTALLEVFIIDTFGKSVMTYLNASDAPDPWGMNPILFILGGVAAVLLIQIIVAPVVGCVLTQAVADTYLSRAWGLKDLWRTFVKYAWPAVIMGGLMALIWFLSAVGPIIIAASLGAWAIQTGMVSGLTTLLMAGVLALVFGIPAVFAGVYVNLRFMLAFNAMVLEDKPVLESFQRAAQLMKGRYWQGFSLWFVMFLIAILLGFMSTVFVPSPSFEMLESERIKEIFPQLVDSQILSTVLGEFMGMFSRTFIVIGWTLFYFSIRCRTEGFDLLVLSERFSKRA